MVSMIPPVATPTRPLSVVMVIQTFYPFIGGAERQCLQLSKTLQAQGVSVKVFTERWKGLKSYEEIEGIPVKRIGRGGPRLFHSILFMGSVIFYLIARARTYQVIHVHLAASHAVAAALVGKLLKKKVIVKIGGGNIVGEIPLSRKTIQGRLKLWALGFLKPHFVVLNEEQKKELHGFGLEKVPVTLIHNGVDTEVYRPPTPEEKLDARKNLGWTGFVFLFVGRFSADKIKVNVLENFLKGWAEAVKNRKDVRFTMVGQGPLEEEYKAVVTRLNLNESVHFLPSTNDVQQLYRAADVFVLPSLTEGLSNALLEAMGTGLPVLASRVPGIIDIIQENSQGFLFDPMSLDQVRGGFDKFIDQPIGKLKKIGENSRNTAVNFSIEKTVVRYLDLYL